MRVLWLTKGLGPGGAERLLVTQATRRSATIEADAAYLVPWKDQLVPELTAVGVACRCLSNGRALDVRWIWRLRRLLRTHDVVHVHSPLLASATRVLRVTLRQRRRPALVTTEHNVWARHAAATRIANRLTIGLEDRLFAVSDAVRASMPARVRGRVEVLTHGIDLTPAQGDRDATRSSLGVAPDEILCLTVANLRGEKDYPTLLDAAAKVIFGHPHIQFLAAGQGPKADDLRALHLRLGLHDRFRFLGYRDDVGPLLAAADLFVIASRHAGLPVALMEALAAGLPVVATRVGGIPEAITDGQEGLLVAPGDPAALASAIVDLATDSSRRSAMAAAACARAPAFDADGAVRRVEAVYVELFDRR